MKKESVETRKPFLKRRSMIIFLGSASFFVVATITFAVIFYFAYFFSQSLKIMFQIAVIIIGTITYYILISEFITFFNKK